MSTQSNLEATPLPEDSEVSAPESDKAQGSTPLIRCHATEIPAEVRATLDIETVARKNSASLEKLMKKLYGD